MWVLRAYDTRTDELEGEVPLPTFDPSQLNGAGEGITRYGSTPLPLKTALQLVHRHGGVLPKGGSVECFLDYEVEPERATNPTEPVGLSGTSR